MTAAQAAHQEKQALVSEHDDLIAAAFAVFQDGGSSFHLPSLGKDADNKPRMVTIRPARMGQIAEIMKLFREMAQTISHSQIAEAIKIIANVQQQKMAAGENARDLDIAKLAAAELNIDGVQKVSLVSLFMETAASHLPTLVTIFSDLTEEQFKEMDLDEGAMCCFAIFTLNYDFFTRRLLPILLAFAQSLVAQKAAAASAKPSIA